MHAPPGFEQMRIAVGFAADFGPIYTRREADRVWFGFRVAPEHANPRGLAHGGALATFADMQLAALMRTGVLRASPTISLALDYLSPARVGAWIEGEVKLVKRTARLAFSETVLFAEDEPVVRAKGIFAHAESNAPLDAAPPDATPIPVAPAPEGYEPLDPGPGFGAFFGPMGLKREPLRLGFRVASRHINLFGLCHGGALAMLADYQLAPLRRAGLVDGPFAPTLSLNVDYLAAARLGDWVEAEATLVRATGRYVFTQAVLSNGAGPVARSTAIYAMSKRAGNSDEPPATPTPR
jgi:uncharacterized protein (TIGR00369 family)